MLGQRVRKDNTYMPHPNPKDEIPDETPDDMGLWTLLKTLIIPALISLILYLIISYAVVPIWKCYRGRYSSYLPLERISNRTTSWRQRIQAAVFSHLLPSTWRRDSGGERHAVSAEDGSGSDFDEEEGEELHVVDDGRREALSLDARRGRDIDGRRLSRDLEEGFRDDSEDEDDLRNPEQGRSLSR